MIDNKLELTGKALNVFLGKHQPKPTRKLNVTIPYPVDGKDGKADNPVMVQCPECTMISHLGWMKGYVKIMKCWGCGIDLEEKDACKIW